MGQTANHSALMSSPELWLILAGVAVILLAGLCIHLWRKVETTQSRFAASDGECDNLLTENARLSERLSAKMLELEAQQQAHANRLGELQTERDEARQHTDTLRDKNNELVRDQVKLDTRLSEEQKASQEKLKTLQQAEERLKTEFENLANRIFDTKAEKFSKDSKADIANLLTPVREQLKGFQQKVEDVYVKESESRASLFSEIKNLKALNERISADALNLTNALKGESKTRGNWGELRLERILEDSGLRKGHEYDVQEAYRDEEGRRLHPDVVVHLPEAKDVIVDSKVALAAYDRYHGAKDDHEREQQIKQHVTSIRNHIRQLSDKNYDDLIGVNSLDLVLMFVPIEPALLLALEHDDTLLRDALDRKILLVGPTTLLGTLQIIYNIWRYEHQNRNALEIARQAGALHDQFVLFVGSLDEIGKHLDKAQDSYTTARKRLTDGKGNLVGRTVKLERLGAKTKKSLPTAMLEEAAENNADAEDAETDISQLTQTNEMESENT